MAAKVKVSGVRAMLDFPSDGEAVQGDVVLVWGWCVFPGSHVARIEVSVDGEPRALARPLTPREDLALVDKDRDAAVGGFQLLLPVDLGTSADTLVVTVTARSLDGRTWISSPRTVKLDSRTTPARDLDRAEVLTLRARELMDRLPPKSRKLVIFTHALSIGGGQLWLQELITQARNVEGLEIEVVSFCAGELADELETYGIPVHVTVWMTSMESIDSYLGRVEELAVMIRLLGAGVVLVNTLGLFQVVDAAELAGVPCMWAIHESYELPVFRYINWGPHGVHPLVIERFNETLGKSAAMIFEASQTADIFIRAGNIDRCHVVDYGIDLAAIDAFRVGADVSAMRSELGYSDDDVVITVIGTLEERKAQAMILAAFEELAKVYPHLKLLLVGAFPSSYHEALKSQVASYGLADRVRIQEVTSDIYRWYAITDIYLSASDIESLPRSMLEAMAFELPVVSTDIFGVASVIRNGVNGWTTGARDLESITGLLQYVLTLTADQRKDVAEQARKSLLARQSKPPYGELVGQAALALINDPAADLVEYLGPPVPHHADCAVRGLGEPVTRD